VGSGAPHCYYRWGCLIHSAAHTLTPNHQLDELLPYSGESLRLDGRTTAFRTRAFTKDKAL